MSNKRTCHKAEEALEELRKEYIEGVVLLDHQTKKLTKAEEALRVAREALTAAEWGAHDEDGYRYCPVCHRFESVEGVTPTMRGHKGCILPKAITKINAILQIINELLVDCISCACGCRNTRLCNEYYQPEA